MTTFRHKLPFGAELTPDGVSFCLWAPTASKVELALTDSDRFLPMVRGEEGWCTLTTPEAGPGTRYGYRINGDLVVPDPASRLQAEDVHGSSVVTDPASFDWQAGDWKGRPWEEAVFYELHVGTFTHDGTFDGVRRKLDHLQRTGITAVELLPISDFPGRRNWGYDGVLHYAPDRAYGDPDDLKRLVDEAHQRGLMVALDLVYNHFGPDGNYLWVYAENFFDKEKHTPWGAAIDFSRPEVRQFFVENSRYWVNEFRIDAIRYDAVHAIIDDPARHVLNDIATAVKADAAREGRHVHLVLENDDNAAWLLGHWPKDRFDAQWNDDFHHIAHVCLTGQDDGYYRDYQSDTVGMLGRALAEGFIYQGEPSGHRDGQKRGEPSGHLPPAAFVNFVQNHDQIGNRAFGERLTVMSQPERLKLLQAALILSPAIPMLFMGEEWGEKAPFLFFCDFHDELADAVREGRRGEFAAFAGFAEEGQREAIPDPNAVETFTASRLDWPDGDTPELSYMRDLLTLRRERIVPLLPRITHGGEVERLSDGALTVTWKLDSGGALRMALNLSDDTIGSAAEGETLFASSAAEKQLEPWSIRVALEQP